MRTKILFTFITLSLIVKAQSDSTYVTTEVESEIYTINFASSKEKLNNFFIKHKLTILHNELSKTTLDAEFILNKEDYSSFDTLLNTLGYPISKKVHTISNYDNIKEINLELNYLQQKKDSYIELLKKIDEKSEYYITIWQEKKQTEDEIHKNERELLKINKKENTFRISLKIQDEISTPEYTAVSFVNMPGLEYSYLRIETPKSGISAKNYQGYFLKYLFTRGKSFGTVGVYKNYTIDKTDSLANSEMFILGIGQDFYSRHLGRGTRKFFNLYSGYIIGGILATSKVNKSNMFFISPTIGLEIYKNKNILFDSKINYFAPLTNNRYLRGLSFNTSFNFIF
jgi:hypothetical protein